jgi:DNA-binding beta-propeller fold protein YncE
VDAASSTIIKYPPLGKKLMTVTVGEQPDNGSPFDGTTDVAFGPNGRIFITDGYSNARVLEYTAEGRKVKQWGKPGSAPGEFNLPHAIQIDSQGIIYVADRENGRIEKFDLNGNFLGEIVHLGRTYSLKLTNGALWASMGPFDQPPGAPGWVVKLDPRSGKILGHLDIPEEKGGHSIELMPSGEPIITLSNELLWFKKQGVLAYSGACSASLRHSIFATKFRGSSDGSFSRATRKLGFVGSDGHRQAPF